MRKALETSALIILAGFMIFPLRVPAQQASEPELGLNVSIGPTNLLESANFTLTVHVTNLTQVHLYGVYIYEIYEADNATAQIYTLNLANPPITDIAAGKTVTFTQRLQASSAGTFSLAAVVEAGDGYFATNQSPDALITTVKLGPGAMTDASGFAQFKIGKTVVPIGLYDADTGSALSDFVVGLALDPRRPGQALVSATDKFGRYPAQHFLLQGATNDAGEGVARNSPREQTAPLPIVPVQLPVAQACGSSSMYTEVLTPYETMSLGVLAPPPPAIPSAPDPIQIPYNLIANAYGSMVQTVSDTFNDHFATTSKQISCGQAIKEDIFGVISGPAGRKITEAAIVLATATGQPGSGAVFESQPPEVPLGSFLAGLQAEADLINCNGYGSTGVLWQYSIVFPNPFLPITLLSWNSPNAPVQPPTALVQVATSISSPSGYIQLVNSTYPGEGIQAFFNNGSAAVVLPASSSFDYCVHSPGSLPQSGQITVNTDNTSLQIALSQQPADSATLSAAFGQNVAFVPKGTTFTLTPHFYDANNNEVQCGGSPQFYAHNPVGRTVALVDPNTGVVTIQDGCGAASIYAWCGGVQSQPFLVSSDCNGADSFTSKFNFALNPTSLTFSAVEGEANPPCQSIYIVSLTSDTNDSLEVTTLGDWINWTAGNPNDSVCVDISGLSAGTYLGSVEYVDHLNPSDHVTVIVKTIIKPQPAVPITGTWTGTWTSQVGGFGDNVYSLTWNLVRNGNRVAGTYSQTIISSDLGESGTTSGSLVDGSINGNVFTISTDGGTVFKGNISGNTISGTGDIGGAFPGPFSIQKQ